MTYYSNRAGAKLNPEQRERLEIAFEVVDRHLDEGLADKVALRWTRGAPRPASR